MTAQTEQRAAEKHLQALVGSLGHGELDREVAQLTARFGRAPKRNDVLWSILNRQRVEAAEEEQWGLYRNATLDMAMVLIADGRFRDAVGRMLEVCYWDLSDSALRGDLLPTIAGITQDVAHLGGVERHELRRMFMVAVHAVVLQRPRAADPHLAWKTIEAAIQ